MSILSDIDAMVALWACAPNAHRQGMGKMSR